MVTLVSTTHMTLDTLDYQLICTKAIRIPDKCQILAYGCLHRSFARRFHKYGFLLQHSLLFDWTKWIHQATGLWKWNFTWRKQLNQTISISIVIPIQFVHHGCIVIPRFSNPERNYVKKFRRYPSGQYFTKVGPVVRQLLQQILCTMLQYSSCTLQAIWYSNDMKSLV